MNSVIATPKGGPRKGMAKDEIAQMIADYEATLPPGPTGEIPAAMVETTVKSFLKNRTEMAIKGFLPWQMPIPSCCSPYYNSLKFCLNADMEPDNPESLCILEVEQYLSCRVNIGNSREGKHWMACYHDEPQEEEANKALAAEDMGAMRCFIDDLWRFGKMHARCVNLQMSPCGDTYEGPIKRVRYPWRFPGVLWARNPISAQCSRTMQGAVDSYEGVMMKDYSMPVWTLNHKGEVSAMVEFSGADEYEC